MDGDLDSAARYRQRAEELRVIAEESKNANHRKTLIEIASEYDRMADQRERIAQIDELRDKANNTE